MTGDLRPLVIEAAQRGASYRRTFTTFIFAEVLVEHFHLRKWPDDPWTIGVLEQIPCVVWLGFEGVWQYIDVEGLW